MAKASASNLVSHIYEAAIDPSRWSDAVIALAGELDCGQVSLEHHDYCSNSVHRCAPLTDASYVASFRAYYGKQFSLLRRTQQMPLGRPFRTTDFLDAEQLYRGEYFNDWWLPQGVDKGGIYANLRAGKHGSVILMASPYRGRELARGAEARFMDAIGHISRALSIHESLRYAEFLRRQNLAGGGRLIVSATGRILAGDDSAKLVLHELSFLNRLNLDQIETGTRELERRIRNALAGAGADPAGSMMEARTTDGRVARIDILPGPPSAGHEHWLLTDEPAVLLNISVHMASNALTSDQLMLRHGLTRAEARVAVEIARGDGRAAVGQRLGIREATVRAHLSAIFEKLGVNRQAELTRMILSI